jgi:hypothetical protein
MAVGNVTKIDRYTGKFGPKIMRESWELWNLYHVLCWGFPYGFLINGSCNWSVAVICVYRRDHSFHLSKQNLPSLQNSWIKYFSPWIKYIYWLSTLTSHAVLSWVSRKLMRPLCFLCVTCVIDPFFLHRNRWLKLVQLLCFWTLSIVLFLFKTQTFGDWILSLSSGGTYSLGSNWYS